MMVVSTISLERNVIHLWTGRLVARDEQLKRFYDTCSPDEQRRANAFQFRKHRTLFVMGRGVLRGILGHYLGLRPEHVRFQYGSKGKPTLARAHRSSLYFNAAHSDDCVLYAITRQAELGVDIERVRALPDKELIAEQFFSPGEFEDLNNVPPHLRDEAFFNCWTRKEACLKATGDGLSGPLNQFRVSLIPGEPPEFLNLDGHPPLEPRWTLYDIRPIPGYVGAVAIGGHGCSLTRKLFATSEECLAELHRNEA